MRSTLHIKFILLYIILGFLSIFTASTLTRALFMSQLEEETPARLYREASLVSSDYLKEYFSGDISLYAVRAQLEVMKTSLDATLWFVDSEGELLISASQEGFDVPGSIRDFNPAEAGGTQYLTGTYHGYFPEDVITVIAPITQGFATKGYLLIHKPLSTLEGQLDAMMAPVYTTVLVIFALSFIVLIGIHYFIYRPLQNVTDGATQYASGNLDYEIPVHTHDEMGYLSASLNYMASHLRDMEAYQKKFVANVSHDFRSPLTSIRGYVKAMADGTIPVEMQEKYLNIILFETERLTDLTNDLLTLNEFDTKELLLDKTDFDIQEMIKNTANSFEGTCTKKRISIELLSLPKEARVHADARKIQQVLYNLLDNAIKFSGYGSTITVEVSEKSDKIFISVKDSGRGIAKKDLGKIWERFYKTDQSRGKDKKGTGLGLSIVKEVIQAHDEHINVISTEGVGTEFIFSLSRSSA